MSWSASGDSIILGDVMGGGWSLPETPRSQKTVYSLVDGSTGELGYGGGPFLDHDSPSGRIAWDSWFGDPTGLVVRMAADDSIVRMPYPGNHVDLSPDGLWLAYLRQDGTVAVSPVPPTGLQEHPISRGLGEQPQWFPSGDRLAYRHGRNIWEVAISTEGGFRAEEPRLFARGPFARVWFWSYDVAPDGRMLVVLGPPEESVDRIDVVTNVFALLGR